MSKSEKFLETLPSLVFAVILLAAFLRAALSPYIERNELDIVAYFSPVGEDTWELRGRVHSEGSPVNQALVWVILRDARGNRNSPPTVKTDAQGEFRIESIPKAIGKELVTEGTIYSKAEILIPESKESRTFRGKEHLRIAGASSFRSVDLSGWVLLPLPLIFLVSALLPFIGRATRVRHVFALFLAFMLTGAMIAYLSLGLRYINTTGTKGEVLSLGFGSIFYGTYVERVQPEWLFSLTAPYESATKAVSGKNSLVRGFGAPLWVLLLSVVGAGLLTVAIIVNEISNRPDFSNEVQVRQREETIIRHQFFILFAPLGAIFAYQLLVIADAADQPVTVALAAVGAGATLNAMLARAVAYSRQLLERTETSRTNGSATSQQVKLQTEGPSRQGAIAEDEKKNSADSHPGRA